MRIFDYFFAAVTDKNVYSEIRFVFAERLEPKRSSLLVVSSTPVCLRLVFPSFEDKAIS